jgi:hypothetical protein
VPNEIATIMDADGKLWTGPVVSIFRIDFLSILLAILTEGLSLLFQSRKKMTVRVNGDLHYGTLVGKT